MERRRESGCGETISRVADSLVLDSIRMVRLGGVMTVVWLQGGASDCRRAVEAASCDWIASHSLGAESWRTAARPASPLRYVAKAASECRRLIDDYGCF